MTRVLKSCLTIMLVPNPVCDYIFSVLMKSVPYKIYNKKQKKLHMDVMCTLFMNS